MRSPVQHGLVLCRAIGIAPPEFRGGTPGMWSPEDLLVAAVASCYSLTLEAIAVHRGIEFQYVDVRGIGFILAATLVAWGAWRLTHRSGNHDEPPVVINHGSGETPPDKKP